MDILQITPLLNGILVLLSFSISQLFFIYSLIFVITIMIIWRCAFEIIFYIIIAFTEHGKLQSCHPLVSWWGSGKARLLYSWCTSLFEWVTQMSTRRQRLVLTLLSVSFTVLYLHLLLDDEDDEDAPPCLFLSLQYAFSKTCCQNCEVLAFPEAKLKDQILRNYHMTWSHIWYSEMDQSAQGVLLLLVL